MNLFKLLYELKNYYKRGMDDENPNCKFCVYEKGIENSASINTFLNGVKKNFSVKVENNVFYISDKIQNDIIIVAIAMYGRFIKIIWDTELIGNKCPQCGSESIIFPRDNDLYCEDCGWPDEDFND